MNRLLLVCYVAFAHGVMWSYFAKIAGIPFWVSFITCAVGGFFLPIWMREVYKDEP